MNWIRRNGRSSARAMARTDRVLASPGTPFDEDMAARQQGDDQPLQQRPLADDVALEAVDQAARIKADGDGGGSIRSFEHESGARRLGPGRTTPRGRAESGRVGGPVARRFPNREDGPVRTSKP